MLRNADVAKMLPCVPAAMTATEATNTMKSEGVGMARSRPGPGGQPTPRQEPEVGDSWDHGAVEGIGPLSLCQKPGSGSGLGSRVRHGNQALLPMTQKGFLAKRKRPCHPR